MWKRVYIDGRSSWMEDEVENQMTEGRFEARAGRSVGRMIQRRVGRFAEDT